MSKPLVLDLFCGSGGAGYGYSLAGFEVIGVDNQMKFWKSYPFKFLWMDAFEALALVGKEIFPDLIHASPPCQAYSKLSGLTKKQYPELIEPTREGLRATGLPYIIENVEAAPLLDPVLLCGTMFPELRVLRHRIFESNLTLKSLPHPSHPQVYTVDKRRANYKKLIEEESFVTVTGGGNSSMKEAKKAMGIDWMSRMQINQAIPPAYTKYLGTQALKIIR